MTIKYTNVTTGIEEQIQDADEIMTDYVLRTKLKPKEEEILHCYMAGIGTTKISALLGIENSTVWCRRHRIQVNYRKYIDPNMESWPSILHRQQNTYGSLRL